MIDEGANLKDLKMMTTIVKASAKKHTSSMVVDVDAKKERKSDKKVQLKPTVESAAQF